MNQSVVILLYSKIKRPKFIGTQCRDSLEQLHLLYIVMEYLYMSPFL
jgi:hypothetical protein